jgi:hypothetical protein
MTGGADFSGQKFLQFKTGMVGGNANAFQKLRQYGLGLSLHNFSWRQSSF